MATSVNRKWVSRLPPSVVNAALTIRGSPATADAMQRTPTAGGFFLVAPIVIGFFAGIATDDAMRGVLIGTATGIALLAALWLLDRRRGT